MANSRQKFGVTADYWTYIKSKSRIVGRFKEKSEFSDKYVFKSPSLGNISETFPYFNDGSVEKLDGAVWIMAKVQLDIELSKE